MLLMLDPLTGDLALEKGNLVWGSDFGSEVAQRLRCRLKFFKGEWYLDKRLGTPWYQRILGHKPSDRTIRTMFSNVITGTPGISALIRFDYTLDRKTRQIEIDFEARLSDGSLFKSSDYSPFIVSV